MDSKIINILELLQQHGFAMKANIAPKLNELFHYPLGEDDERLFNHSRDRLIGFLDGVRQNDYFLYNAWDLNNVTNYRQRADRTNWFGDYAFVASITDTGLRYLADEIKRRKEFEVSDSVIATNKSVQNTNESMVSVTTKQNEINKTIADNSTTQTNVLLGTALFAFLALCVSSVNLCRDIRKDKLEKRLQEKDSLINTLRKEQYRLKTDTSQAKEAKKISTKKKGG